MYDFIRKPNTKCIVCETPFYARPHMLKKGKSQYCSKKCYLDTKPSTKNYPIWKPCPECGTEFEIKESRLRRKKFCSQSCSSKFNNRKRLGVKYNGVASFRTVLLSVHEHKCMICGYSKFVDAHHIKQKSKGGDNSLENGILLCPNHHREADKSLLSADYLLEVVNSSLKNNSNIIYN